MLGRIDAPGCSRHILFVFPSDEELRSELFRHLELLRRSGIIRPWYYGAISAGQEWNGEIEKALRSADVVLLLVSVDLLKSSYVTEYELPIAFERQGCGEALVIPPRGS